MGLCWPAPECACGEGVRDKGRPVLMLERQQRTRKQVGNAQVLIFAVHSGDWGTEGGAPVKSSGRCQRPGGPVVERGQKEGPAGGPGREGEGCLRSGSTRSSYTGSQNTLRSEVIPISHLADGKTEAWGRQREEVSRAGHQPSRLPMDLATQEGGFFLSQPRPGGVPSVSMPERWRTF